MNQKFLKFMIQKAKLISFISFISIIGLIQFSKLIWLIAAMVVADIQAPVV